MRRRRVETAPAGARGELVTRRRRGRIAITSLLAASVLASCGDDGVQAGTGAGGSGTEGTTAGRAGLFAPLTAHLAAELGIDEASARCLAEAVVDAVGTERVHAALEDASGDFGNLARPIAQEMESAVIDAAASCEVEAPAS